MQLKGLRATEKGPVIVTALQFPLRRRVTGLSVTGALLNCLVVGFPGFKLCRSSGCL